MIMEENPRKKIILTIPLNNYQQALLVSEILNVDKEFKGSGIERLISPRENSLIVTFEGIDYKKLRVTVNALLKNLLLILKTIEKLSTE